MTDPSSPESLALGVLELFMPRHLDSFEAALIRFERIVSEAGQLGHQLVRDRL